MIEFTISKVTMVICGAVVVAVLITGFGSINSSLEDEIIRNRMKGMVETLERMQHLDPGSTYLLDPRSVLSGSHELRLGSDYLRLLSGERTITVPLSHPLILVNHEGERVQEIVMDMDDILILTRIGEGTVASQEKVSTSFPSVAAKWVHSSLVL